MRWQVRAICGLGMLAASAAPGLTQSSTRSYTYDAHGRLVQVTTSGGSENGTSRSYQHDAAGNRTQVAAVAGGGVTCSLQTYDAVSTDEFAAYAQISPVGSCPVNVALSYSIVHVSGTGQYQDMGWFPAGNILSPGQAYKLIRLQPWAYSVPDGQTLVLRIDWIATSGNATISPASSYVTFYSSY